jgi:hypothetical protein
MMQRRVRRAVQPAVEGLEGRKLQAVTGRLSTYEIQQLMSDLNQAEILASNVAKKRDDTVGGIIDKIG